ncbi:MAG: DUF600 family protein [Desulfosarcinaceae bacterium]
MNSKRCDELIQEVGALIVNSEEYANMQWEGIAVVGDFSHGQQRMNGYVYFDDGDFKAEIPGTDALRRIRELRQEMKKETNEEWHQCLIHVTKPDFKIKIKFEYEDPDRWSLKKISRDMSDYAESLKPPLVS